jgi:hypothetical protein
MYSISHLHTRESAFVIENQQLFGFGFQLNQLQAVERLWQA